MDAENFLDLIEKHWQDSFYCYAWHTKLQKNYKYTTVEVAPVKQEMLGGNLDGKIVMASFYFDLSAFIKEPEIEAEEFGAFSKLGKHRQPHLFVKGKYTGFNFHLSIYQMPPKDVEVSEYVDVNTREVVKRHGKK